jgi:glycosyltransferase involved in cell wall biosynthesis
MSAARPDVALDVPRTRHMSTGMLAYADELAARLPRVAPDLTFVAFARTQSLTLGEQLVLPWRLRRAQPRLVHFLSVYAPLLAPRPYAITIHDLIHLRYPQYFKRSVGPYYASVVSAVCAGAARVITDDARTVGDLERFLGVRSDKVRVIPLGVDDAYRADAEPERGERPYFLYVGNHRPHKDLATLFAAWEALEPQLEADLYLTGPDDLEPALRRPQRVAGSLRFLGGVSVERLRKLYAGAVALVHPSLCEGFGLPLLEAASVGARVIACADAIPGTLRPYVDSFAPRDVRALTGLMANAAQNPVPAPEARRFARTQTWDRCAERTAEVYREVLEENRGR